MPRSERFFNNEIQLVAFHFTLPLPRYSYFSPRGQRETQKERKREKECANRLEKHFHTRCTLIHSRNVSREANNLISSTCFFAPPPPPSKISSNQRIPSNEEIKASRFFFFLFFLFFLFPGSFNRQRPSIHPSTFDGRLSLVRPRKSLQILGIIVIAGSRLIKACTR